MTEESSRLPGEGDPAPVLATMSPEEEAESTPGAGISGVLSINAKGCLEIGGNIVVAPSGSRVTHDPIGIEVPGAGRIPLGSTVIASGAYLNASATSGPERDVVLKWGKYRTSSTEGFVSLDIGMTHWS